MVASQIDLDAAYDLCKRITKAEAKNFYYAFRTLPSAKRRAIYAAYAFCRVCDDISDEDLPLDEKLGRFAHTRELLTQGRNEQTADPVVAALSDAATTFEIPWNLFEQIVDGVEMDLERTRYETFEELWEYCYKVASVVGLVSVEIFGHDEHPNAERYAVDLGLAMQLTNIIRDVKEDASRGRIYFPQSDMRRFGYSEQDLMNDVLNESFRDLMRLQIERARRYFETGRRLIPLLSQDSRACTAVLIEVYSGILDRIEAADYDVFSQRVTLTTSEKLITMARLWAMSLMPALTWRQ